MRRLLLTAAIGAILLSIAVSTLASPSLEGYTGLLLIPNADSLAKGAFNVGYVNSDIDDHDLNNFFANYGLETAPQSALEIGVNVSRLEDHGKNTYINGKFTFQKESLGKTGIAAGVIDATGTTETTLYIVGSKVLVREPLRVFGGEVQNPRVSFGIGGGSIDGLFAGLSAGLGNRLTLMAEYDSENVNLGAKLFVYKGLAAEFGYMDVGGEDEAAIGCFYTVSF